MKIFLSYTTRDPRDAQLAARLRRVLPRYGADVFFAPEDIRSGEDWEQRLFREIDSCSHFVVILSAQSVKPGWVVDEMNAARARKDRDDAFVIVPVTMGEVEHPFTAYQCIEYREDLEDIGAQVDEIARKLGLEIPRFRPTIARGNAKAAGSLIPKLCNRERNEREFRGQLERGLRERRFAPQIYFLTGPKQENHRSLVERFRYTYLEDLAAADKPSSVTQVGGDRVDWPLSTDVDLALDELLVGVFALVGVSPHDGAHPRTAAEWKRLSESRAEPVYLLEHDLRSSEWHSKTVTIVDRYVRFWEEVAALVPAAQHIVFLNVIADSEEGREELAKVPETIVARAEKRRAKIKKDALFPLLHPLKEPLRCVEKEHVEEWFEVRASSWPGRLRDECCSALFAREGCVPMRIVEMKLNDLWKEHGMLGGGA